MTEIDWSEEKGFPGLGRKLRILVAPANEGGCSYYRAISPYNKLVELFPDVVEIRSNQNPLGWEHEEVENDDGEKGQKMSEDEELEDLNWCDIVMTQNIANFGGQYTARVVGKAKELGKFVHYDTDDLLTELYEGHRLENVYKERGLSDITKFIYSHSDIVSVTQNKFANRIAPYCNSTLIVLKNAIDYNLPSWRLAKSPSPRKLCRVGWVGGIHHEEDVKEFAGIPHLVNQKAGRERVHWGFYGRPPVDKDPETGEPRPDWQQDVWDNYEKIMLKGFRGAKNWHVFNALNADAYGMMFSRIDLAIAPLQMNNFNDSKSDIKVAECGKYKIPLIASDVGCYDETIVNGETGYLISPDAPKSEWVRILTKCIKNPKHVKEMGENLHEITEEYFDLNKTIKYRLDMYHSCFKPEGVTSGS